MIAHRDEIYSRPKRTWFVTEKEKKLVQKAAKENATAKENGSERKVMSVEQAEDLKMKEKRKREREKNLPRKKRRKLEAAREQLEDEDDLDEGNDKTKKEKSGISLVDLAYRRAKAVKAVNRAVDAGKIVRKAGKKPKPKSRVSESSRTEEKQDLFQNDMRERKQRKSLHAGEKKKSSFKSKSRYKRR